MTEEQKSRAGLNGQPRPALSAYREPGAAKGTTRLAPGDGPRATMSVSEGTLYPKPSRGARQVGPKDVRLAMPLVTLVFFLIIYREVNLATPLYFDHRALAPVTTGELASNPQAGMKIDHLDRFDKRFDRYLPLEVGNYNDNLEVMRLAQDLADRGMRRQALGVYCGLASHILLSNESKSEHHQLVSIIEEVSRLSGLFLKRRT